VAQSSRGKWHVVVGEVERAAGIVEQVRGELAADKMRKGVVGMPRLVQSVRKLTSWKEKE
jgi:hypothetical protein